MDADIRKELDEIRAFVGMKPVVPPVDLPVVTPFITPIIPVLVDSGMAPVPVYSTPYIDVITQHEGYLASRFWGALQVIAQKIAEKYPDRIAKKMVLITACPPEGEVWSGSEFHLPSGEMVDLCYYTYGESNITQGKGRVEIWNDDGMLNGMFDRQRTLDMMKMIVRVFPRAVFIVDNRIKIELGMTSNQDDWIQGDLSTRYNHDRHMHVHCRDMFDVKAVL